MPERFKKRIVKFLKHTDYTPVKLTQLVKALGVSSDDYPEFKMAFDQLRQAGHLVIGSGNLGQTATISARSDGSFEV